VVPVPQEVKIRERTTRIAMSEKMMVLFFIVPPY
jgi:hypothetical protein